jgi:hypothetical protein
MNELWRCGIVQNAFVFRRECGDLRTAKIAPASLILQTRLTYCTAKETARQKQDVKLLWSSSSSSIVDIAG